MRYRAARRNSWPAVSYVAPDGFTLGKRCFVQRREHRSRAMPQERLRKLDDLGFPWEPNPDLWDEAYRALAAWRRAHPDRWPPDGYVTQSGLKLGAWASRAKARIKNGRMPKGRVQALRRLGFGA